MTDIIYPARVKIGGLWKNETKSGIIYYSGDLGPFGRVEFWPNKKREGENGYKDPDFNLYVTEKMKKATGLPSAVDMSDFPAPKPVPMNIADFPGNEINNVPF